MQFVHSLFSKLYPPELHCRLPGRSYRSMRGNGQRHHVHGERDRAVRGGQRPAGDGEGGRREQLLRVYGDVRGATLRLRGGQALRVRSERIVPVVRLQERYVGLCKFLQSHRVDVHSQRGPGGPPTLRDLQGPYYPAHHAHHARTQVKRSVNSRQCVSASLSPALCNGDRSLLPISVELYI